MKKTTTLMMPKTSALDAEGIRDSLNLPDSARLVIDPPEGWRYGFPKILDQRKEQSLEDWLLEQGYPANMLTMALNHSRYWSAE